MATIEAAVPPGAALHGDPPEGRARVLHSHQHAALLHRAVLDMERVRGTALMERAAAEAAYQGLSELRGWSAWSGAERLARIGEEFVRGGLGLLDLGEVGLEGGKARVVGSHFARGWMRKYGAAKEPVCAAAAGFLSGALAAAFDRRFRVEEVGCAGRGEAECRFRITGLAGPVDLAERIVYPVPSGAVPPDRAASPLDGATWGALLGSAPAEGGHLQLAGEELSRLWADYHNRLAFRFEREIPEAKGAKFSNLGSIVLTEVGHRSAFDFFGSVFGSDAWLAHAAPSLRSREDWLHAGVALVNGLGWGEWEVHALVPGERLSVRVYDSYEGTGYRGLFGRSPGPRCYLARGTAAALMNLVYRGDPRARPELSATYYNDLFRTPMSFRAVETRCRAMDDPYCEFVVNPLCPVLV